MDRTYILHRIYTSENSAEHRDTQLSEMYPDVAWCLENWQGFSLTSYERQLEKDPEDQELILKVRKCKTIV